LAHTWLLIESFTNVTEGVRMQSSVTVPPAAVKVALLVAGAGTALAQFTAKGGGHVMTGGMESLTVTR
jgi:hypothetical protein